MQNAVATGEYRRQVSEHGLATAKGRALTEAGVLAHCQTFLPPAKTPKQVVMVSDLPKSDRGKVLRDKLRDDWLARQKVSA